MGLCQVGLDVLEDLISVLFGDAAQKSERHEVKQVKQANANHTDRNKEHFGK